MNDKVIEFRGVDMLCIAEVKCDDNSTEAEHGYVTGDWESLAPVAEVSKTVETSSESKYYDNQPMLVIRYRIWSAVIMYSLICMQRLQVSPLTRNQGCL